MGTDFHKQEKPKEIAVRYKNTVFEMSLDNQWRNDYVQVFTDRQIPGGFPRYDETPTREGGGGKKYPCRKSFV